jgi:hypothetical protein
MHEHDCQTRELSTMAVLTCGWPALLLATVCLLPFLNKAFLIDDPHFLAMARQILKSPSHPMDFEICWNIGLDCTKAYALTTGNVLMGYALVPTILLGAPEWMAHLTQLVFVWVAIIAMSSLMLRLGYSRFEVIAGTLLLVAIPPFLPMASTAMPDVLAAAVGLVAIERLAAWKACGKWSQAVAAGVALGLAGIARAHLALFVPLGALYLFDSIRPREMLIQIRQKLWLWFPVLIGAGVLFASIYATRERSLGLDPPASFRGIWHVVPNLRAFLLYLCVPLPLAGYWIAARWTSGSRRIVIILLAVAIAGMLIRDRRYFFAVVGGGVVADLLLDAYRGRNHTGLFLALWMLVPLPIVYYGHLPPKYLLPCMPAVILICFRLSMFLPMRTARVAIIFVIIGGVGYSLLILRSDAEFAEFGRAAMDRLVRPHAAAGERVWFGSHVSAYWYAGKAGGEVLPTGDLLKGSDHLPKPGDLLAVGLFLEDGRTTLRKFPRKTLLRSIGHTYRFGRTMGQGVGLYTNQLGTWLWGFGTSDDDRYELWRID